MSELLELCHCGHHKDTHFESGGACLGMRCDDCTHYRPAVEPDTLNKKPEHPDHAHWCLCYRCKIWSDWCKRQ